MHSFGNIAPVKGASGLVYEYILRNSLMNQCDIFWNAPNRELLPCPEGHVRQAKDLWLIFPQFKCLSAKESAPEQGSGCFPTLRAEINNNT
jgi:hypothetical protein